MTCNFNLNIFLIYRPVASKCIFYSISVDPVLRFGPATAAPAGGRPGGGLLVNVSRGIAAATGKVGSPSPGRDVAELLAAAAADWSSRLTI